MLTAYIHSHKTYKYVNNYSRIESNILWKQPITDNMHIAYINKKAHCCFKKNGLSSLHHQTWFISDIKHTNYWLQGISRVLDNNQ